MCVGVFAGSLAGGVFAGAITGGVLAGTSLAAGTGVLPGGLLGGIFAGGMFAGGDFAGGIFAEGGALPEEGLLCAVLVGGLSAAFPGTGDFELFLDEFEGTAGKPALEAGVWDDGGDRCGWFELFEGCRLAEPPDWGVVSLGVLDPERSLSAKSRICSGHISVLPFGRCDATDA